MSAGSPSDAPALGGRRGGAPWVTTFAGDGQVGHADGPGPRARFHAPMGVALGPAGRLYVADTSNHRIRVVAPDGTVTTLAGDGSAGLVDGPGAAARFRFPRAVAVDRAGAVYVADTDNDCLRKIAPDGHVTTFCGGGSHTLVDGPRAQARFAHPNGVAVGPDGTVYVSDASNRVLRAVTPGGTASTIAGDGNTGFADARAKQARFSSPRGLAVAKDGTLYVADCNNARIRALRPDGRVVTIAGDGRGMYADGPGLAASFHDACDVAIGPGGELIVAETYGHRVRVVGRDGVVRTLAGPAAGTADHADGPAADARFNRPFAVAVDEAGVVYVADTQNHCIRRIGPEGG